MSLARILLIDDEPRVLNGLRRILGRRYDVSLAQGAEEAFARIADEGPFAAAVCDLRMPGMDGLTLLRELRRYDPFMVRMVLTGTGDLNAAIEAVNDGEVFRFHTKPVPTDVLIASLAAAVQRHNRQIREASLSGDEARTQSFNEAIANHELRLFVQPQVDIIQHRIKGIEALVRWQHPTRGLLPPGSFLSEVEATGAMRQLTDWMVEAACGALAQWRETLNTDLTVAVNITALDLADSAFSSRIGEALARHHLPPAALELELVEGAALDRNAVPRATLTTLEKMGIALSLDDFGTGYSAFGHLLHLPVKTLKIDRIFVSDADQNADALRIVEAIIDLGHDLSLLVVAEGVETQGQMDALHRVGCKLFQGFHIAHPMPAEDFTAWFAARAKKAWQGTGNH